MKAKLTNQALLDPEPPKREGFGLKTVWTFNDWVGDNHKAVYPAGDVDGFELKEILNESKNKKPAN